MLPPLVSGQSSGTADLTLRAQGSNTLTETPSATNAYMRKKGRRVLLIHGYNVSELRGLRSMAHMRHAICERAETLGEDCLTVTWPGNRSWLKGRAIFYSKIVPVAVEAARVLHAHLMDEYQHGEGPREIVIIAHSLGCRLTLEFLGRLRRSERPRRLEKVVVVLMAAAVPVEMDGLIREAVANADGTIVLHSVADKALSRWFPPGQTMAGEGWWPEAIGLNGLPSVPGWSSDHWMKDFDHGDYWTSDATADTICETLREYWPDIVLRNVMEARRGLPSTAMLDSTDLLPMYALGTSFGADY